MSKPKICVVGACNIDLISYVPKLPVLGETLHGNEFRMGFGGKGANQAVMAAKLGGEVSLVTKLGKDMFGENTLANLKELHLNTDHVLFTDEAASGVAPIAVDPTGANSIIIVTGANDLLTEQEIEEARPTIAASEVLVCQLEVPLPITLKALKVAREEGVRTIFNPAPGFPELPEEIYGLSDIICPNEGETALVTGIEISSQRDGERAARVLIERGSGEAVLTLGAEGVLWVTPEKAEHIPGERVTAVDTTGAGDAFVGSLAFFLAAGREMADAIARANRVAAISVQGHGTQTSFPFARDLPAGILD